MYKQEYKYKKYDILFSVKLYSTRLMLEFSLRLTPPMCCLHLTSA